METLKNKFVKKNKLNFLLFRFIFLFISFSLILFSCGEKEKPELETLPVSSITMSSAKTGGKIINQGSYSIKSKGVCWSTNNKPTIEDYKVYVTTNNTAFNAGLTNLDPNTTYYVRAFVENDKGTYYGNTVKFTTSSLITLSYRNYFFNVYPIDNSTSFRWGISGIFFDATSDSDGEHNTNLIITSTTSNAAEICASLNSLGFSNWYLPSRNELNLIYENKHKFETNNFSQRYWSSTEFSANRAYSQNFDFGEISIMPKNSTYAIRCIRKTSNE